MFAYYNEIDPFAVDWLRELIRHNLIADGVVDNRSIIDVDAEDLDGFTQCHFFAGIGGWSHALRLAGWADNRPVWTGSPPCQPFSTAGTQKGKDDDRHLAPHWLKLIQQCHPPVIFGEQVAAAIRHEWLDDLQDALGAEGYTTGQIVLPACGLNAPHIRQRLWLTACRMGNTDGQGLQGHRKPGELDDAQGWQEQAGLCSEAGGDGRLADSADSGLQRIENEQATRVFGEVLQQSEAWDEFSALGAASNIKSTHAPLREWDVVDWLFCRDGKWRPVEPIFIKMVDGVSGYVGQLRQDGSIETTGKEVNEYLQIMRKTSHAKTLQQRGAGVPIDVEEETILRQKMHGKGDDEGNMQQPESQQIKISEAREREMSVVRGIREATCSPFRSQPEEQFRVELDDIVSFLSSSISFSQLRSDHRSEIGLRALQQRLREDWTMQHSPESIEEIWASFSKETKSRIRMDFNAARWQVVVPFPLTNSESDKINRAPRLKGYGNAIVPGLGAEIIMSVIEYLEQ